MDTNEVHIVKTLQDICSFSNLTGQLLVKKMDIPTCPHHGDEPLKYMYMETLKTRFLISFINSRFNKKYTVLIRYCYYNIYNIHIDLILTILYILHIILSSYMKYIRSFVEPGSGNELMRPVGVAVDANVLDQVYVASNNNHRIEVFREDGTFVKQFGQLKHPWNVTINNGKLYVADCVNHRISIFTLEGQLIQPKCSSLLT